MPIYTQIKLIKDGLIINSHEFHHYFEILTANNIHDSHTLMIYVESLIHQILDNVTL
jgi:hypothetical protein